MKNRHPDDQTLVCKDCGMPFEFTAHDQRYFAQQDLIFAPRRCKPCRAYRRTQRRARAEEQAA